MSTKNSQKNTDVNNAEHLSHQQLAEFFHKNPLLASLPGEKIDELVERCAVRHYHKGNMIFCREEPSLWVYFIYSGSVSEIINYGGSADVLSTLRREGDYIGEMGVLIGEPYTNTAIARGNVTAVAMPREAFLELTQNSTAVANYITIQFIHRLMSSSRRHLNSMHLDAPARLGYVLLSLSGSKEGHNDINVTQSDLAASAGIARQTVAVILGEWRKKGWVKTERGHISICEPDSLLEMINSAEMR